MINEKSKSKVQQKFFGMALAYKRGELPNASQEVIDLANSMSEKELKKFAKTKHKGLPNKVKTESLKLKDLLYEVIVEKSKIELIVKSGTELYHGTGEDFDEGDLGTGGYDKILWTTDKSLISQTYIPKSGIKLSTDTNFFLRPKKGEWDANVQRQLGIDFDRDEFEYRNNMIQSYTTPLVFRDKTEQEQIDYVHDKLSKLGYEPENGFDGNRTTWKIFITKDKIQRADEAFKGRLFILTAKKDLRVYDNTRGGETEGDLTDVEYHSLGMFRAIEKKGYDGVKINDFAQSVDMGNFGHESIGFFKNSIKNFKIETIEARHRELYSNFKSGDYESPELKKYRGPTWNK